MPAPASRAASLLPQRRVPHSRLVVSTPPPLRSVYRQQQYETAEQRLWTSLSRRCFRLSVFVPRLGCPPH
jgi:hypothetical protein